MSTTLDKIATAELNPLIARRRSSRGFDPHKNIDTPTLVSILEAARWSASSRNLQPWQFIVARRENQPAFQQMLSVIKEGNQQWAQHAAVLMVAVLQRYREPGVLHRTASHDLGLATSQMILQALHHDIYACIMGGFYPDKARELYNIPEQYEPFTALAFGYRASDLSHLDEAVRAKDAKPRQRQPLDSFVFSGTWAESADFLK